MALFFLAALAVFVLARVFRGRAMPKGKCNPYGDIKPEKEPVSPWPPLMALGLILLLALIFAIYNGLMLAQVAINKDEIPQVIRWLSWLREHQANELIGGTLAGVILYEGFRRTQKMSDVSEGALKNSAIVILPAALFFAVALLSREGVLERISNFEAGGVKVTMQPMGGAGGRDAIGQSQSAVAGSSGVIHDPFPNLRLLSDLINGDERKDLIARDLDIIRKFSGRDNIDPEVENVAKSHRDFLRLFGRNLSCLTEYVSLSNDSRLMAIAGVDIPLGVVVIERTLGKAS